MPGSILKNLARYAVPRSVRNWLRSPSISLARLSENARFSLGTTRTFRLDPDIAITLHPHAFKVAYRDQVLDPDQHAEVMNFVTRCTPQMVLFDIGAHYGIFSLIAANRGATVIAVEPSTAAVRMIARQAALNHESDRIHIVHAAASSGSGTLKMLGSGVFSDDYFRVVEGRSPRELMSVRAVTIDSLAAEFGSPTHIKIDVEGQEAAVLAGGRETLARHSPELFLELHNQLISEAGGEPSAALNELRTLGYRTFALDGVPIVQGHILQQTLVRLVATKDGHA